jgi:hypothetical protein
MMPLTMVNTGEPSVIKKVGGKEETRRFLEKLGFVFFYYFFLLLLIIFINRFVYG